MTCFRQALFALVWFRKREGLTVLGAGFGISRATAYRYRDEAVAVLAAEAPELTAALNRVQQEGWSHVILDGKIVDTDRCRAKTTSRSSETIDLWYSGKRHDLGGNVQAVTPPGRVPGRGRRRRTRVGARPDLRAGTRAGRPVRIRRPRAPTLADPGYEGAGHGIHTPFKQPADGRRLDIDNRTYNMLLRSLRGIGERGFALLSQRWRVLQHVTTCPQKIGAIAKAALVLTHFQHRYLPC